jgi:hypothetical protein
MMMMMIVLGHRSDEMYQKVAKLEGGRDDHELASGKQLQLYGHGYQKGLTVVASFGTNQHHGRKRRRRRWHHFLDAFPMESHKGMQSQDNGKAAEK